jgi:hypothetical protein
MDTRDNIAYTTYNLTLVTTLLSDRNYVISSSISSPQRFSVSDNVIYLANKTNCIYKSTVDGLKWNVMILLR